MSSPTFKDGPNKDAELISTQREENSLRQSRNESRIGSLINKDFHCHITKKKSKVSKGI
jgi:hypothetical protein